MKPERWQQIDKILEAALEREESQRATFLDQACGDDEALRKKVEALLAAHKQGEDFLEEPALEVAAEGLAKDHVQSLVGQQISSYKILSLLGAGGMGEVFLAQDTTLDRKVALKFLPEELQQDSTAKKRFLGEAKSAAALDHPFICKIYEVGEAEEKSFISMEYVQGETLKEMLEEGPLPLKEALEKATEVAEALEEAHKQGIIHRDLKPGNIMLTPQGHVKVLDFGLAKQVTPAEGQEQEITTALTQQGSTLGTVPYMSPEQIRGQVVDPRSDIFSFGVVLYEMLTGVNPFKGDTSVDTSHAILGETPPPLTRYTEDIPVLLQHTVKKMLAKEPDRRFQLIHEVRTDLGELIEESGESIREVTTGPSQASSVDGGWRRAVPWAIALAMTVTAGVAFWNVRTPAPEVLKKFVITPAASVSLLDRPPNDVAISPDGKRIVYRAENDDGVQQLYLRSIGGLNATPLPGSAGVSGSPFFSPDGESVAMRTTIRSGQLVKISLTGGPPIILCDLPMGPVTGSWTREDIIVFSPDYGIQASLYSLSAAGGEPEILAEPNPDNGEIAYRYPVLLPDGKAVIFTLQDDGGFQIAVLMLETREQKIVIEGGKDAHYSPTGHLIYTLPDTGSLMAVPFDLVNLEVTGNPVQILEGVREHSWSVSRADYAFSEDGTLVYIPAGQSVNYNLVWVDREGRETLVTEGKQNYFGPRVSPDGKRVVFTSREAGEQNVWIYNLEGDSFSRLTFDAKRNGTAEWSPDGQWIIFGSTQDGPQNLYRKRADGSGSAERLTTTRSTQMASSWSPDGSVLTFSEPTTSNTWILQLDEDREPQRLDINGSFPVFSPDGQFLVYSTPEKGGWSIYVSLYAQPEIRWLVSGKEGGRNPVWSPDGTELFYLSGEKMMVVAVQTEPTFSHSRPRVLFQGFYVTSTITPGYRYYDISPDGQRFLMIKESSGEDSATQINVVLNWFEELKRLVPTN